MPADYPHPVAAEWPDLLEIVERRVKDKRGSHSTAHWWQFERRRGELYHAIVPLKRVLVIVLYGPHLSFSFLPKAVYANKLGLISSDSDATFAVLQSRVHEIWTRTFGATLKNDLAYALTDCLETFPFLPAFETAPALEAAGRAYHDHRAGLMIAHDEGMTKTYNRFHARDERSADIATLRDLHAAMDRAVLDAYGWDDLAARAEPVFLDETNEDDHTYQGRLFWPSDFRDEVLARLLALNADRAKAERDAGLVAAPAENEEEEAA